MMNFFGFGRTDKLVQEIEGIKRELELSKKREANIWSDIIFSGKKSIEFEKDQTKAYSQLAWVAAAVDAITIDVCQQPWFFVDKNGKDIDISRVNEQVRLPFELGYQGISFKEMLEFVVMNKLITGNAYLLRASTTALGQSRKIYDSFIPLPSSLVNPCLSRDGLTLEGYKVCLPNTSPFEVPVMDIIHIRQNCIVNPFVGVGNITKMRLIAEGESEALKFQNEFLERRALPGMIVTDDSQRTPDDLGRITDLLRKKTEGIQNVGKSMYFSGQGVKVLFPTVSQKDMQFIESRQFDRQTTLSVFGVPPERVGISEISNRAVSQVANLTYLRSTVNGTIQQIIDFINSQHVHKIDPYVSFKMQKYSTGDIELVVKKLQNGIITPNMAAEELGESFDESDELRNTYYFQGAMTPIDMAASVAQTGTQAPQKMIESKKKDLSNPKNVDEICEIFTKSATRPKQFQVRYLRAALTSRNKVEDIYTEKIAEFFVQQKKRVIARTQQKGIDSKELVIGFDLDFEDASVEVFARGLHTSGVQRAVGDINNISGSRVNLSMSNPFVKAAILRLGEKIKGINETTQTEMSKLVQKSTEEQWTINQLQDAISDKFNEYSGYRARMIARTESRMAWDAGASIAYKEIGVKTVDVVGCTQFEPDSDCGKQHIPVGKIAGLSFHPNHIGCILPSEEP